MAASFSVMRGCLGKESRRSWGRRYSTCLRCLICDLIRSDIGLCILNACFGGAGTRIASIAFLLRSVVFEGRAVAIAAHGGSIDVAEKGVGGNFTRRTFAVFPDEIFGKCCRDGGMFEGFVDDGCASDPGRDKNGRNANAESIEMEGIGRASRGGLGDEAIRGACGRLDVIVDASVFVVGD